MQLSREAKGEARVADLVRVSSHSRSTAVAGAIAGIMREEGFVEVQAIGAPAVNQAIKAITIARLYLEQDQVDLMVVPSFQAVQIEGEERTAIHFAVYRHIGGW